MSEAREIIRQVKRLEITTRKLVDGLITGNYHSVFKGQGIEFSEIREYYPGDDVRFIDWKVTARFNHPFVKVFIEERDLNVYFLLDFSASSTFGTRIAKRRKALEIVATIMFSAFRNNDKVGAFISTDRVDRFVPARKGKKHLMKLLSLIVGYSPQDKTTNLAASLVFASKVLKKRSVFFIVSDLLDEHDFFKPLKVLKNKHDVIVLRIIDDRERELPDVGLIELEDEETGEQILIDTSDEYFRKRYAEVVRSFEKELFSKLRKLSVDVVEFHTESDYVVPLKKFFRIRKLRVNR